MAEPGRRDKFAHLRDASWKRIVESEKALERSFQEGRLLLTLAAGLVLVGFLLVAQWRGYASLGNDLNRQSDQSLGIIIEEITTENSALRSEVLGLQLRVFEAERAGLDRGEVLNEAAKELAALRVMAGLEPASGPGVVVVIEDPRKVLLAQDFVTLLHELRAGGAEAVAVDGVRVVSASGFEGENGELEMDGVVLNGPYRVIAIGNPADLEQAVTLPGGFASTLSTFPGVGVDVARGESLHVPAAEPPQLVYGEPTTN